MKNFISVEDVPSIDDLVSSASQFKKEPYQSNIGDKKTLGLIFFNPSLRTRLSTVNAAKNLGMEVMVMNVGSDSWQLETEEGVIMDQDKAEHVKDAAAVIGSYCDIVGVRSFPTLEDAATDYREKIINAFVQYTGKPIVNLESATLHPLQSLTDLLTIREHQKTDRPKVVLTWAPHVKPLPQSVANSFAEWMMDANVDLTITHPPGMDLSVQFTGLAPIEHHQEKAFEGADFVYVKNWSSFSDYGKFRNLPEWMITKAKLDLTNNAKMMHCLPVRRNVVISDDALDSEHSIVQEQARNRLFAAQAVLKELLEAI